MAARAIERGGVVSGAREPAAAAKAARAAATPTAALRVGPADDAYEREADRVAEAVARGGLAPWINALPGAEGVRRRCDACAKEDEDGSLRRDAAGSDAGGWSAPPIVHDVLRSPGRLLDPGLRAEMERGFGHDFSRVRVHDDVRAAESARAVNAHAYTVGEDVVFATGRYAPASAEGRRLLAHELAHGVQQGAGRVSPGPRPGVTALASMTGLRLDRSTDRLAKPARSWASSDTLEDEARTHAHDDHDGVLPRLGRATRGATPAEQELVSAALVDGAPLPVDLRRRAGLRFGDSLDDVRVHAGGRADVVARALGARAWSFGRHIGLGGRPTEVTAHPSLTHEIVHAAQARDAPSALLRDEPRGVRFDFSVRVHREMNSDELLLEFIRQYTGVEGHDAAVAARDAGGWHWTTNQPQSADAVAVRRGYVLIHVFDRSITPVGREERRELAGVVQGMGEGERDALHDEVDRRFWERTHYRPGERLGQSRDDRRMAEYWRVIRDDLVQTRQAILELPQHVRDLLFDPAAPRRLNPVDYEIALRAGRKLAGMSAIELAEWQSRTNAVTDDWARFDASLDRYLAREAEHRREQLELGERAGRLYGLEDLYALRKLLRSTEKVAGLSASDEYGVEDPTVVDAIVRLPGLQSRYAEALRQNGFADDDAFEAAIVAWRHGFERETVRIADRLLDQLDHRLFEAERQYGDQTRAAALATAVGRTSARAHYEAADDAGERAISYPRNAMDDGFGANDEAALAAGAEAAAEERAGDAEVASVAAAHPVVGWNEFPSRRLARAAPDEVSGVVLDYLAERRRAVASTRGELHDDTDFIYKLDNLMATSRDAQGITAGSIYEEILEDYISRRSIVAFVKGVALTVFTLALTILTFGTGTLAVAAGVTALGISAWQAVDAFREYARMSDAHDAELLSEDPSMVWVVIAVVGAAADLGAAVAAVRSLRTAAQAFEVTGDIAAFRRAVDAIPALDARIAQAVHQAAEVQKATRAQWRALMAIGGRANDILGVVAESGYRLMVLAWHMARRGFWRFDQYLAELQRLGLIADAAGVTAQEARALLEPFEEGLRRARTGFLDASSLSAELRAAAPAARLDDAAAFGRFLGLSDESVAEVLELQAVVARRDPGALAPARLQAAMRERAGIGASDELVADVRGLPESGTRTVDAIEQSYEIGVAEGRRFLEGRGWRQWDRWINPFELNGRYGQGIDDVFLDDAGRLWVVEYKGGASQLSTGQMSSEWVASRIARIRAAGHTATANALLEAFNAGTLRGVVVSTPHGSPAGIVQEFTYP